MQGSARLPVFTPGRYQFTSSQTLPDGRKMNVTVIVKDRPSTAVPVQVTVNKVNAEHRPPPHWTEECLRQASFQPTKNISPSIQAVLIDVMTEDLRRKHCTPLSRMLDQQRKIISEWKANISGSVNELSKLKQKLAMLQRLSSLSSNNSNYTQAVNASLNFGSVGQNTTGYLANLNETLQNLTESVRVLEDLHNMSRFECLTKARSNADMYVRKRLPRWKQAQLLFDRLLKAGNNTVNQSVFDVDVLRECVDRRKHKHSHQPSMFEQNTNKSLSGGNAPTFRKDNMKNFSHPGNDFGKNSSKDKSVDVEKYSAKRSQMETHKIALIFNEWLNNVTGVEFLSSNWNNESASESDVMTSQDTNISQFLNRTSMFGILQLITYGPESSWSRQLANVLHKGIPRPCKNMTHAENHSYPWKSNISLPTPVYTTAPYSHPFLNITTPMHPSNDTLKNHTHWPKQNSSFPGKNYSNHHPTKDKFGGEYCQEHDPPPGDRKRAIYDTLKQGLALNRLFHEFGENKTDFYADNTSYPIEERLAGIFLEKLWTVVLHKAKKVCRSPPSMPLRFCKDHPAENSEMVSFVYSPCYTPSLSSVSVQKDTLRLSAGVGEALPCQLTVRIGEKANCAIRQLAPGLVICQPQPTGTLDIGQPQNVYLSVKNNGIALPDVKRKKHGVYPTALSYTFLPTVKDISPKNTSTAGGAILSLRGYGFTSFNRSSSVRIGLFDWINRENYRCKVMSVNFNLVTCKLPPIASDLPAVLSLLMNVTFAGRKPLIATCTKHCSVDLNPDATPSVLDAFPTTVSSIDTSTIFNISGERLDIGNSSSVMIGGENCTIVSMTSSWLECEVRSMLPAGEHNITVFANPLGFASTNVTITSLPQLDPVTASSSVAGGLALTLTGAGFTSPPKSNNILIGGMVCRVVGGNTTTLACRTPPHRSGNATVVVRNGLNASFPEVTLEYSVQSTPMVFSAMPSKAGPNETISLSGSGFSNSVQVSIKRQTKHLLKPPPSNRSKLTVQPLTFNLSSVKFSVPALPGGNYEILVSVSEKGDANQTVVVNVPLEVMSVSPSSSGLGGGARVTVTGQGFGVNSPVDVTVCDLPCLQPIVHSLTQLECSLPALKQPWPVTNVSCNVSVETVGGFRATAQNLVTLSPDLTANVLSISPQRGGTGGGTRVTITGTKFVNNANITIGGAQCVVRNVSQTTIVCVTEARKPSVFGEVRVFSPNDGFAASNVLFHYVDVWSSPLTWGGKSPPGKGEILEIKPNETLLLDSSTEVLKALVVRGALVFDRLVDNITLQAENIIVSGGGKIEVGTEVEPFLNKATIRLFGHRMSTEIPLYGAKTLSVRHGSLDLHGKPLNVTWTHLAQTANAGDVTIDLVKAVDWEVGGEIVIAATGYSQRENEVRRIAAITHGGTRLVLDRALTFEHLGVEYIIDGVLVLKKAEVGLLTRNIVVEGNVNRGWNRNIDACPKEFEAGQFKTQTCFEGRYGAEVDSDQFGAQMMIFADIPNLRRAMARLSYIEVRRGGQAFNLGRYPIHYHMSGDINGSYVRGCAIHHTFNRAVTIHGVHHLLVEDNVAFNNMGHAYFLEDGVETGNVLQRNLGVFTRSSSSLLNVDITPATFWITNPKNIFRGNAAAGGTHFGYWFQLPNHPEGPSFNSSICVRYLPLGEFVNNSAHSFGRYGVWVWRQWYPRVDGLCAGKESRPSEPAKLIGLTSWHNENGAEIVNGGAIQMIDTIAVDNKRSGIEVTSLKSDWTMNGARVQGGLMVARSNLTGNSCTSSGVHGPHTAHLTIDGTTFVNFDKPGCAALRACSHCKSRQGGWETRVNNLRFVNSPNRVIFKWQFETVFKDLDGSLSGSANNSVLPTAEMYNPTQCRNFASVASTSIATSVCDQSQTFRRMSWNNAKPTSLLFKDVNFTSRFGTSFIPFKTKRLTGRNGWMVVLATGYEYQMGFQNSEHIFNLSYAANFYDMSPNDVIVIRHQLPVRVDKVSFRGRMLNDSRELLDMAIVRNGDYAYEKNSTALRYAVRGQGNPVSVSFKIYRCLWLGCVPPSPPPQESVGFITAGPNDTKRWSDATVWENSPPRRGDDVIVQRDWHLIVDTDTPPLRQVTVYGTLEFDASRGHNFSVTYLVILGGRVIAGSPRKPFVEQLNIRLTGNIRSERINLPGDVSLGAKAIGVFGWLELYGVRPRHAWTTLNSTARKGDLSINVADGTNWKVGDRIVITSTSFDSLEAEEATIAVVSDGGRTLVLENALRYEHKSDWYPSFDGGYGIRAEVGLLNRNIVIDGIESNPVSDYGGRVLVGRWKNGRVWVRGLAILDAVEIARCGQLGWSDKWDYRAALAFLSGFGTSDSGSSITYCSIHDSFNSALAAYTTDYLNIDNNVFYKSVGASVLVSGRQARLHRNLAAVMLFPGTYNGRFEPENIAHPANFRVTDCFNLSMTENVAAGSERLGFHIDGEPCPPRSEMRLAVTSSLWYRNTAHSTLQGVHIGYSDGQPDCLMVRGFFVHNNFDFGIFAYTTSSVFITDSRSVDNGAGVIANSYRPRAIKHRFADKFVMVTRVHIVGASRSLSCSATVPASTRHPKSRRGVRSSSKGHVGFVTSSFNSDKDLAPFLAVWHKVHKYPAINGITTLNDVTLENFGWRCNGHRQDVAITSNPKSADAQHPVKLGRLLTLNVNKNSSIFVHEPSLGLVNPSDCVDMDCDGLKHILIHDTLGAFTGRPSTVIAKAEFQWGGDRRRGLGDYRIPKSLLTANDGSKIGASTIAPHKGINRGTFNQSQCMWKSMWNAYHCTDLKHRMLVIESMDADTEVRRLSPVALLSDGYIDLLNGPQDHGWCDGYTCQQRISTFYGIVSADKYYRLHFSSTNPQHLRFHMLNSNRNDSLSLAIFYRKPQRLDVYVNNVLVDAANTQRKNGKFQFRRDRPLASFIPNLSSKVRAGTNFFHQKRKTLYIVLVGSTPVEIKMQPVILLQLSMSAAGVTTDQFFEDNLVQNLASLLNVDSSKVRILEIVRGSGRRKRRQTAGTLNVQFEIGDPPAETLPNDTTTTSVAENTTSSTVTSSPFITTAAANSSSATLGYTELLTRLNTLLNQIQTEVDLVSRALNITVTGAEATQPEAPPTEPPPVPVNITRNTSNNLTIAEQQALADNTTTPEVIIYKIPTQLRIFTHPGGGAEGEALQIQPAAALLDGTAAVVENVGVTTPWELTATLVNGGSARLIGNSSTTFSQGWANFSNIIIDRPGTYRMTLCVTYPTTASFCATTTSFTITERQLRLVVAKQPTGEVISGRKPNPLFSLEIQDTATGQRLTQLGWAGRTWTVVPTFTLAQDTASTASITTLDPVSFVDGFANFTNFVFSGYSSNFVFSFAVKTTPSSAYDRLSVSAQKFTIRDAKEIRLTFKNANYRTAYVGREAAFKQEVETSINRQLPAGRCNVTRVTQGSILIDVEIIANTDTPVSRSLDTLNSLVRSKALIITAGGETIEASGMTVDGREYGSDTSDGGSKSNDLSLAVILVIILSVLLVSAVIIIAIIFVNVGRWVPIHAKMTLFGKIIFYLKTRMGYENR